MNYLPARIRLQKIRRRGSVLVMAIVIITMLFMVGSTFLLTSRTTKQTVAAIDSVSSLDNGIDAVIDRINTVLVDDLFGNDGVMLNSSQNASDEYWDYPYTSLPVALGGPGVGVDDDMWLASIVPQSRTVSGNTYYYWPHVTDLYNTPYGPFGGFINPLNGSSNLTGSFYYSPDSYNNTEQYNGSATSEYYKVNYSNSNNCIARVIRSNQSTEIVVQDGTTPSNPNHFTWLWGAQADADGDGISDSYWVKIPEISGPDSKNLYAAVRIIDNCSMININTAYLNNTDLSAVTGTKGSNLTDVSLEGMAPPSFTNPIKSTNYMHAYRVQLDSSLMPPPAVAYIQGSDPLKHGEMMYYDNSVLPFLDHRRLASIIPMTTPSTDHFPLPFDLSDELELRNRFCLNSPTVIPLEGLQSSNSTGSDGIWTITQRLRPFFILDPLDTGLDTVTQWYDNISWVNTTYYRRHLLTAYSWDRTMRGYTNGGAPVTGFAIPSASNETIKAQQANINTATAAEIATALIYAYEDIPVAGAFGHDPALTVDDRDKVAQLACNIVDYRDTDSTPTHLNYDQGGGVMTDVFGYDAHPILSKVSTYITTDPTVPTVPPAPASYNWNVILINPYPADIEADRFKLRFCTVGGARIPGTQDVTLPTTTLPARSTAPAISVAGDPMIFTPDLLATYKTSLATIDLIQTVNTHDILIDSINISMPVSQSLPISLSTPTTMGQQLTSAFRNNNCDISNSRFNTVGEVAKVFATTTVAPIKPIGPQEIGGVGIQTLKTQMQNLLTASDPGRLDIENAIDQDLLSRLTILSRIDGANDNNGDGTVDDKGELAIPGRININTAPQKVLEALPWVVDSALPVADREKLAQAIIAYRDKMAIPSGPDYSGNLGRASETGILGIREEPGFQYPAELVNVTRTIAAADPYDIRRHSKDSADLTTMPDCTTRGAGLGDSAADDLEERDIIFHRMSNLVTVRSDTFTAYIMVRLGEVGPQKRMIAIFDRSNVFNSTDVPKLVALHPVPDPR